MSGRLPAIGSEYVQEHYRPEFGGRIFQEWNSSLESYPGRSFLSTYIGKCPSRRMSCAKELFERAPGAERKLTLDTNERYQLSGGPLFRSTSPRTPRVPHNTPVTLYPVSCNRSVSPFLLAEGNSYPERYIQPRRR